LNNFCAADCPSTIAEIDGDALPTALLHQTLMSKSCGDYVTYFNSISKHESNNISYFFSIIYDMCSPKFGNSH